MIQEFKKGKRKVLVQLGCGGGKSYIMAKMIERSKGEVLVLTHRRELKAQHEELFKRLDLKNVRIEMIITESLHLKEREKPCLILADEAHLSKSRTWEEVISYYDTFTIGFTATPCRLDNKPLGSIYESIVKGVSVKYLIDNKCLAPYEYYAPMSVDTDNIEKSYGDFKQTQLAELMTDNCIYSDVVKSYKTLADGKKTIAYCVSVKHAHEMADLFNKNGYPSIAISAGTKNRQQIMDDFRDNKYLILFNVGLISEGISINDVECCLLLRPTMSLALYIQQAMRCMRYMEGKTAIILDCVGNYTRNPLPDADIDWSLETPVRTRKFDDKGNFTIRTCPNCFSVFKTADKCPYCNSEYPLHEREIKMKEEIELQRIAEENVKRMEGEKRKLRKEVGMARTYQDLVRIQKTRNYKYGWVIKQMQLKGIKRN